jgi:hypothetical protein
MIDFYLRRKGVSVPENLKGNNDVHTGSTAWHRIAGLWFGVIRRSS